MPATTPPDGRRGLPLRAEGLRVTVRQADGSHVPILDVGALALAPGAQVAITAPSGAGKSTLIGVLAGLVKPDAGRVAWAGEDISALPEGRRDAWRRQSVGLVFQDFHLVPELDILANILLPVSFASARIPSEMRARAASLAAAMGLPDPRRRAGLLSRGEQQRTAIARALLHEPAVILADEPTASLDGAAGQVVADLLVDTAARLGATLIVATHDTALIGRLGTRWGMSAGRMDAGVPA